MIQSTQQRDRNKQQLLNVLSSQVEIKFGMLVFDAKLITILPNVPPERMTDSFGVDAMLRRFTETAGAHNIRNKEYCDLFLPEFICKTVQLTFDYFSISLYVNVGMVWRFIN